MTATDGLQQRFEKYARDKTTVATHSDVRFSCQAVRQTALDASLGLCTFETARNVVRMFRGVAMYRVWELVEPSDQRETQQIRNEAVHWMFLLDRATTNQSGGVDNPRELRRNLLRELDARNLMHPDHQQLRLVDLRID